MKGYFCLFVLSVAVQQALSAGWSYHFNGGSAAWPSIPGSSCNGTRQSPIDIITSSAVPTDLGSFTFTGYTSNNPYLSLRNNGHGFVVGLAHDQDRLYNLTGAGLPKKYAAHSFHMHWGSVDTQGSEHLKNGAAYPAELHLVHYDADKYPNLFAGLESAEWDAAAVLGVFIEIGPNENTAFNSFIGYLENITNYPDTLTEGNLPSFNLRGVLPFDVTRFWRYNGSLTIPNCQQTIIWTVFEETVQISQAQLDRLRSLRGDELDAQNMTISASDNYRVTSPLYDRTLYYSRPATVTQEPGTTPVGGYANILSPMRAILSISVLLSLLGFIF